MNVIFENIDNLPTPVSRSKLDSILRQLQRLKLITPTGLTQLGQKVSKLSNMDAFYATAVVLASQQTAVSGILCIVFVALITCLSSDAVPYNERLYVLHKELIDPLSDLAGLWNCMLPILYTEEKRSTEKIASVLGISERQASTFMTTIDQSCHVIYDKPWRLLRDVVRHKFGEEPLLSEKTIKT